jgi:DNA polymerase elongation subunit (family B)
MIGPKKRAEVNGIIEKEISIQENAEKVAKELKIAISTAERYIRLVKQYNGEGEKKVRLPKILLLDIETVMMEVYIWNGKYKQTIPDDNIIEDWNIVAWAAKWLFEPTTMSDVQSATEAKERDDKRLIGGMWDLMNEADVLIGHNGDRFDIRKLNARFIEHGFLPPMPYRTIDTLKVAKRYFAFSSYALPFLCKKFGIGEKISTGGYELWKRCLKGDAEALDHMSKYNIQDVLLLEELYVKFRPWIKSHPNVALYMDLTEPVCTNCGSIDLDDSGGYYYTTNVNKYDSVRCLGCGAPGRKRNTVITREERQNILMPTAR